MTREEAVNWLINIMADIGKAEHRELWHYEQALLEIREMLESEPERKKGKWLETDSHEPCWYKCDQCGRLHDFLDNYCPNCGSYNGGDTWEH